MITSQIGHEAKYEPVSDIVKTVLDKIFWPPFLARPFPGLSVRHSRRPASEIIDPLVCQKWTWRLGPAIREEREAMNPDTWSVAAAIMGTAIMGT
jgi:hypothetical protein